MRQAQAEGIRMIRELKTLVAVAREGTFAAAGDRIGLTQAAVSAQMQRLEDEVGGSLFDRTGRTAKLNARGLRTLEQAHELLRLYAALGREDTVSGGTTLVTIGAIASAQRSLLPDALAAFHSEHPSHRSRVLPGLSMDLLNAVDAGDVELAITIRPPHSLPSDLRWTPLVNEPYRLVVPKAVTGDDWLELLGANPFIRYDRSSYGGRQVDHFLRRAHIQVNELCELDELEAIVRLVGRGLGVALVPHTAVHRRWPASVRAVDLGVHTFHRDIGIVHRARRNLTEPVQSLVDLISAKYQELPPVA